jgi:hypothetical protein
VLNNDEDLSKKFEAIISNSGAILLNHSEEYDEEGLEEPPQNQIISDEESHIDMFGVNAQSDQLINHEGDKTNKTAVNHHNISSSN